MRVALLGSGDCLHSVRWANGLANAGVDVHLVSAHPFGLSLAPGVTPHTLRYRPPHGYFLNAPAVGRLIQALQPDVVNTHYASGYGTLGRLSGCSNNVLSVWGSDVFDFPRVSAMHRGLVRKNLAAARVVTSISHVMKDQCLRVCPLLPRIEVIPWGVDSSRFVPPADRGGRDGPFTVGTVKVLKPKYGIDTLIQGFAKARQLLQEQATDLAQEMRLRIVGDGAEAARLKSLAGKLGLSEVTDFIPAVSHDRVPDELAKLDTYVAVSRLDSESFGVAIVEALACERPVIVSDAGGLPEVVRHNETGVVIPREDPAALASAIVDLALDPERRERFGKTGRADVMSRFEWERNVAQMVELFDELAPMRSRRVA